MERLEGAACESKITGLVLVQPAFLKGDPAELFAQARQIRMPVRLVPPLVQPLAPEGAGGVGSIRRRGFDANPERSRSTGRIP